jgi:puromycin-sensitive aminopeptidase
MNNPHRLPNTVLPSRYTLEIWPDLEGSSFEGSVAIQVELTQRCSQIVLNALDLTIHSAWVAIGGNDENNRIPATATFDPELERVTLSVDQELPAGPATLHLRFTGIYNEQLVGFYKSTFTRTDDEGSTEHTLAVTQFESTHARRCFPCFDEPVFKAVFSITLTVPEDVLAISNSAEVLREDLDGGLARITFADTMAMSTYLVAFVIGPLEQTPTRTVAGINGPIPLRVIYPPGSAHLCEFALDVEEYYGIAYPGDKVDLVAVPDFAFGAMENLGCITFREVLLLVDPSEATQPELQRVADVINHELAHMWFGDLVTMEWWNGIWLNEAFATFMEVSATDAFRPDWQVWTSFGLARAAAFDTDALQSTRPIEFDVQSPAEAEAMFDILTYEKGASVVRMLEQYLGAEVFRSGINAYLLRHAYGVTETTDLWDALEDVSGEPVRRIMDSWIFRGGHPLVTAQSTERGLRVSQDRFSYQPKGQGSVAPSEAEIWPIPLRVSTRVQDDGPWTEHRLLLEEVVELDLGGPAVMVQANPQGHGFFRVNLSDNLRSALATDPTASSIEAFVLLDDSWAGFLANQVGVEELEALIQVLSQSESDPVVWRRIISVLSELQRYGGQGRATHNRGLIQQHCGQCFNQVEKFLRAPDLNSDEDRRRAEELRGLLFSLLGGIGGDGQIRAKARELWQLETIDPSLRAAAVEVLAMSATPEEHAQLEQAWRDSTTPQEEIRLLSALIETADPELFAHVLELSLSEVRTQNAPFLLRRAISHRILGEQGWDFVSSHWSELVEKFPSSSLPRMLEGIRSITDRSLAERVAAFVEESRIPTGERVIQQHLERMWVSVEVAERLRA